MIQMTVIIILWNIFQAHFLFFELENQKYGLDRIFLFDLNYFIWKIKIHENPPKKSKFQTFWCFQQHDKEAEDRKQVHITIIIGELINASRKAIFEVQDAAAIQQVDADQV